MPETPAGPIAIDVPTGVHPIAPSTLELARRLDVRPGERVLELGCGAGLLAVVAARLGAGRVLATDIDERACRATAANARASGVADRVEVRCGSHLEPARGERFDLILFNPPQTPGPRAFGPKWGGEDGALHFRAVLPDAEAALRPGGRLLLLVLGLVDPVALEPLLAGFAVDDRGSTDRSFAAAEYEGLCEGLVAYLESRAAAGRATLARRGPNEYAFPIRYLRLRGRRHDGPRLVVNADDLGAGPGRNAGIAEAFERGIVRSASILANGPAFDDAVSLLAHLAAGRCGPLDVGLHLNLTEGQAVSGVIPTITDELRLFSSSKAEAWRRLESPLAPREPIEAEVEAQLAGLRAAGMVPTHLDGHRHAHAFPAVREVALAAARRHGLFVRVPDEPPLALAAAGQKAELDRIRARAAELAKVLAGDPAILRADAFCGLEAMRAADLETRALEGVRASVDAALARAPSGLIELMVHPGRADPGPDAGPFRSFSTRARAAELAALTDPSWPDWLAARSLALVSFAEEAAAATTREARR